MRKLPAAAGALSAALHVGGIVWVSQAESGKPQRTQRITVSAPRVTVEPELIEITLLDDRTVATPPHATLAPSHGSDGKVGHGASHAGISTGHATTASETGGPPRQSGPVTVRPPEVTKWLSAEFIQHLVDTTKPLAPKDISSERIADDLAHDLERLHDARWVDHATPDELTAARASLVAHREEQAAQELRPEGRGTKSEHRTFTAHVGADGTAHFNDATNLQAVHVCEGKSVMCRIPIGATFDISDWAMRSHGQDPYASEKLKFLDRTRADRQAIGNRYRHDQLGQSAQLVQNNVAYLWTKTADLAARKQGLFELWDDCAETGDDDLLAGGTAARAFLVGFIRAKLVGTAAYSSDELARLNAHRHSKATFAPYVD